MTARPRERLDVVLVRRRFVDSRQEAHAAIAAGRVLVGGAVAERPSRLVSVAEPVELLGPGSRFVGRGGEKLDAALFRFGIPVDGVRALDAGASTGGFTDCLLQRGAAHVLAVDVGHGQLHQRLRADPRVAVLERTNVRALRTERLREVAGPGAVPVDVVTSDLSFISLTAVVPVLAGQIVAPGGHLVVLVKPQFEVGRADASRGKGVIRDPELWRRALGRVASSIGAATAAIMGAMPSPVTGAAGNTEFMLHALAHVGPASAGQVDAWLDAVVAEASDAAPSAGRGAG